MYNTITFNKVNIFAFFFFTITFYSYTQCSETGFDFGNNTNTPSYNVSGDIAVTLNTDDTITLDLLNFSTASGPDVRVYLLNSNGMSDAEINEEVHNNTTNGISSFDTIQFGEISASSTQSFTVEIPENAAITSYDKIFFYCLQYHQFWDIGSFNSFTASSCSVLNTQENILANVGMFPNPASTTLQLSNLNFNNIEIRIFDYSGKKVFQQLKGNSENTIDISHLKTGLYVLSITENNKQFSQKLMVQ